MVNRNGEKKLLDRITIDPKVLVGKPVIRGTRLSVEFILGLLARGMTIDEILNEYEGIVREDVVACLSFAAQAVGDSSFIDFDSEVA